MIIKLAWRNLWRSRRRSMITISAMTFALTLMVAAQGLIDGMSHQMLRYATRLGMGQIQVHAEGYFAERSLYDRIEDPKTVMEAFRAAGADAAPRTYGSALVAYGENSTGALLWGIVPEREARISDFENHMQDGAFLREGGRGEAVLGFRMADQLGAGPGDEIVVVAQAADGSMGNALFRVSGVLRSVGDALDRSAVFVHQADLQDLLVLGQAVHEVAAGAIPDEQVFDVAAGVSNELSGKGLEIRTWKEVSPILSDLLALNSAWTAVMLFIIFGVAALGVLNTVLMSVFERVRELGVMMAVGMRPPRMILIVLLETFFLSFLSALTGGALGWWLGCHLERHGWDLSAMAGGLTYAGVAIEPVFYAHMSPAALIQPAVIMVVVSVMAAVYPAIRAARLDPVAAMATFH